MLKEFVGEYKPEHYLLNPEEYISMGPLDLQNYFFEHRKQLADAIKDSKEIINKVSKEFEKISGRKYDLIEKYKMDDTDVAVVVLNSTAGTAKDVVDNLRANGIKAGLVKPRAFRPLPVDELAESIKNVKALAIMDKADSCNGFSGPLFSEVTSALYSKNIHVPAVNYIYGLGGRDVKTSDIESVFENLSRIAKDGKAEKTTYYLGVRD